MKAWGRTDFKGKISWIAPAGAQSHRGCVFRARRKIDRHLLDPDGIIQIAAESYYALYVNGHLVGTGPARGTRTCNFLDTHQAAGFLREGENHLAVEVFCNNFPTFHASPAEPALFVRTGQLVSDEDWQVQLASEYRTSDVEVYTLQIGLMEWRDLRAASSHWQTCADTGPWHPATVIGPERPIWAKRLFHRDVRPLERRTMMPRSIAAAKTLERQSTKETAVATLLSEEPHHPCRIDLSALLFGGEVEIPPPIEGGGVTLIFDFEDVFVGHFLLEVYAPAGTVLDVGYQEALQNERLTLNPAHYRFADRWILREGRQKVESLLRWRGGRFVQIALRNFDRPIRLRAPRMIDCRYPIEKPAEFRCSDPFYNELWRRCLTTLSACVTDTVTDCPWREMAFWVNDFLVVNRYWLQMVGTHDVLRRSLALAVSQREANGLIGGVCPTNDDPFFTLFATNLFLPIGLKDYLLHTGDRAFAADILPELADLVAECERHANAEGLLCPPAELWNFVDWSYHFNGLSLQGKNSCVVNWFYVHALDSLADLFTDTDENRAGLYRHRAAQIAEQIDRVFWCAASACFLEWIELDGSSPKAGKLTHSLALLSGRVRPTRRAAVKQALSREDLPLPELYMQHFLFEALAGLGRWEEIDQLIRRHWGSILATDSPAIWEVNVYEHGKEAFSNTSSLCHAFALAPVNFLQRHRLGIQPLEEAFRRFTIRPMLGHLPRLEGTVPTPSGFIHLRCHRHAGHIAIEISVPPGCTGVNRDGQEFGPGQHSWHMAETSSVLDRAAPRCVLASAGPESQRRLRSKPERFNHG